MMLHEAKAGAPFTFDDAAELVTNIGILPLAPLIPEHPSLKGLTREEDWHTDTELDPWQWRVRFPGEGKAAYGKFLKKKAVLVAREWFPYFPAALGSSLTLKERYDRGLSGREALTVLEIIEGKEGIETRQLRSEAEMKAKEKKTAFDNALNELQGSVDIVISGVRARLNADGDKNGWNSTSFETAAHWMRESGMEPFAGDKEEAIAWLNARIEPVWSPEATAWIQKLWAKTK
ncbi:hypothetical protein SAMN04487895_103353 [Paenibacillus sophorae]|uniref:Uncharacterized protein n=2 Tax=Paenibacillus sophorae TaxID=1333845 RepID=A0A1H8KA08_9BACL|nr:hypothetical protein [Paenibacillus sophorae]SEN89744.1 hypothetical protein SAMN04487895_103353 [Paenibacillus sophorae]